MSIIYKYPIIITEHQEIEIPEDSLVLDIKVQAGKPQLWAMVNPDNPPSVLTIAVYGTGCPIDAENVNLRHISTFIVGKYVFHAFQIME